MKQPLISMIVSNLNGMNLNLLSDCMKSLTNPGYTNWELIVVDNNSTDKSVEYLQDLFKNKKNCHVIKNPVNMYSQGLNLGAAAAKGELLAYFNNDVAIKKDYFQQVIKAFDKEKSLGILQGKLVNYYDRGKIDSAGETMDRFGNPITIGAGEKDEGQFDKEEEILSASGSGCVIQRNVFDKLGNYDPDYGIGYEDMDLALRARRLGYKVKRFPKAVVYHKRASTDLAEFIRIKVKWHFNKNRLATMIKNYPLSLLVRTLPVTLVLYMGIASYELVVRKNWIMCKVRITAIFWDLLHLPQTLRKREKIVSLGAKSLTKNDLDLFSQKSLIKLFTDFRNVK
jgi:GT2 family glycosyltransferase